MVMETTPDQCPEHSQRQCYRLAAPSSFILDARQKVGTVLGTRYFYGLGRAGLGSGWVQVCNCSQAANVFGSQVPLTCKRLAHFCPRTTSLRKLQSQAKNLAD